MQGQQPVSVPTERLTPLERAIVDKCAARRQAIVMTRQNAAFLEEANEQEFQDTLLVAKARMDAEDAEKAKLGSSGPLAATDGLGNASVVELRPGGPVEAPAAA